MHDVPALECRALRKHFSEGKSMLEVLKSIDLRIAAGELIAIVGPSGAGKTTLLQLLGGLDTPTSGEVRVRGQDLAGTDNAERGRIRNRYLGFVYQFHHLLPEFTALENVAMPLLLRRESLKDVRARAQQVLERVGLADRLSHKPGELSGGERQRVAVARALVTEPAVVLADEPTGNLDRKTGETVLELMLTLNREVGASLVIVTHEPRIAARMNRVLRLQDGGLEDATAEYCGEITRQRMKPEMNINTSEICPSCNGSGKISSTLILEDEIEKNLSYLIMQNHKGLTIEVNPILYSFLTCGFISKRRKWSWKYKQKIKVVSKSTYHLTEFRFFDDSDEEIKL